MAARAFLSRMRSHCAKRLSVKKLRRGRGRPAGQQARRTQTFLIGTLILRETGGPPVAVLCVLPSAAGMLAGKRSMNGAASGIAAPAAAARHAKDRRSCCIFPVAFLRAAAIVRAPDTLGSNTAPSNRANTASDFHHGSPRCVSAPPQTPRAKKPGKLAGIVSETHLCVKKNSHN